jgi:hypothetical protein
MNNSGSRQLIPAILPIQQFAHCPLTQGKRQKGARKRAKSVPCQRSKIGGKMKRKKTKRKQQDCEVLKVMDGIEQAVSTAKKVYRAVKPTVKRSLHTAGKPNETAVSPTIAPDGAPVAIRPGLHAL